MLFHSNPSSSVLSFLYLLILNPSGQTAALRDFEEAAFVAGVETGFRQCIASSKPDMSDNRVILVRWKEKEIVIDRFVD